MFPDINPNIDTTRAQYEQDFRALVQQAQDHQLTKAEFKRALTDLVTAALMAAYLAGGGNPAQMDKALKEELAIHKRAIQKLTDDLYSGRYTATEANPEPPDIDHKIGLWVFGLLGAFAIGQEYIANQQRRYIWHYSPDKDHCGDCANLNGVVLTAAEWRALGIRPQSRRLACKGYQCGCYREETKAESIGLEAAKARYKG